ncbi:unnamed protein product [Aureobasidium mustum]|uniref:C2H2-type domain-containing protein n=1 Tax=Aureobasidium mustum TaxID=2773714 RepID=A0A9N8P8W8_9PEZI|nr:unnamed protein product [Aureobasidium mustum]
MSKRARRDSESDVHHISATDDLLAQNIQPPGKYTHLDSSTPDTANTTITCALPPHHPIKFTTYNDYEIHYHKAHSFRCLECGKNFPTEHFLSLHIAESHDPLNRVKKDRGEKTYHCFVEDCEKVCSTPQKRRMHLIDKHMFPRNYDFHIVNHGSDNRTSLLRPEGNSHRKQGKAQSKLVEEDNTQGLDASDAMETEVNAVNNLDESTKDESMNDIANAMAALKFVPKSIAFGRGRQRGGFSKS